MKRTGVMERSTRSMYCYICAEVVEVGVGELHAAADVGRVVEEELRRLDRALRLRVLLGGALGAEDVLRARARAGRRVDVAKRLRGLVGLEHVTHARVVGLVLALAPRLGLLLLALLLLLVGGRVALLLPGAVLCKVWEATSCSMRARKFRAGCGHTPSIDCAESLRQSEQNLASDLLNFSFTSSLNRFRCHGLEGYRR